jgi:hypothetical protein
MPLSATRSISKQTRGCKKDTPHRKFHFLSMASAIRRRQSDSVGALLNHEAPYVFSVLQICW